MDPLMDPLAVAEAVGYEIGREASRLARSFRIPLTMVGNEGERPSWTLQFGDDVHIRVILDWGKQKPLYVGVGSSVSSTQPIWSNLREAGEETEEFARTYLRAAHVARALERHLSRFLITYSVMES